MKKKWYDYLWIFSLIYLVLGFFNIMFAWLVFLEASELKETVTRLGLITMVRFKPRSWCVYCPMGTMTQLICMSKAKNL